MKLERLGNSKSLITLASGSQVFFSYNTPVIVQHSSGRLFQTMEHYSKTTSKHITQFLNGRKAEKVEQSFINQFIGA